MKRSKVGVVLDFRLAQDCGKSNLVRLVGGFTSFTILFSL